MLPSKRTTIVAVLSFLLAAGCGGSHEGSNGATHEAVSAPVATVTETLQPVLHEAVGTIQAKADGTISAKIMGTVRKIHVKEGDRVNAGDLLVTLDPRQVSAQFSQARAAVSEARNAAVAAAAAEEAARANAELASTTFERYQNLKKMDSVSAQEYDEVVSRYRQAQSALKQTEEMAQAAQDRVKQAESGMSAAAVSNEDATVSAPFDGTIGNKLIAEGDLATPGRPLLTIESITGFEMAIDLPETLFKSVSVGQVISIRVPALNDLPLSGTISAVSPAADARSRSFLVKVELPEDAPVHTGMFARAGFPVGEERLILVPAGAVLHQGHLTGIFILDGENIARFRLIRTGRELEEGVEVLSGLKSGARFVSEPSPVLSDGTPVEVRS